MRGQQPMSVMPNDSSPPQNGHLCGRITRRVPKPVSTLSSRPFLSTPSPHNPIRRTPVEHQLPQASLEKVRLPQRPLEVTL